MTIEAAKKLIPAGSHLEMEKLLEMDLGREDNAVFIGVYKGFTAHLIETAFGCNIIGFEPQAAMARQATKLLNGNAVVHNFALGDKKGTFEMWEFGNDAASFYPGNSTRDPGTGEMEDIVEVFDREGIEDIALLFMNCEGSEYQIIPRLLESGKINRINQMMIQFHKAATKGNGKQYQIMLDGIAKAGFEIKWTVGSPWTWFVRKESPEENFIDSIFEEDTEGDTVQVEKDSAEYIPEEEPSLSNEVVEEHKCEKCGWSTTAKDYKRAIRRHTREEH